MATKTSSNHWTLSAVTDGRPILLWLSVIAAALLLGLAVGQGYWRYVLLLAFVPVVLRWPVEVTFGLFVLLIPFEDISQLNGEGSSTLVWVSGLLAAGGLIAVGLIGKRLERPPRTAMWWTLFMLWGATSVLWAAEPRAVITRLPTAFSLLMLYVVAASFRVRKSEVKWIAIMMIIGGFAAAIFAIHQFYNGVFYEGLSRGTISLGTSTTNPNHLAAEFLLPIALATQYFFTARRLPIKILMLGTIGVLSVALFLTMSRAGLLGLLAELVVFSVRMRVGRKVLVIGTLLGVLALAMPSEFFARIRGESGGSAGAGRLYLWKVGWELFSKHPVMGAGFDNFPVVYNDYAGDAPTFEGFNRGSHNVYLKIIVELGLVGLLIFLLTINAQRKLIASYVAHSINGPPPMLIAAEAGLWGVLVFAFFGDPLFDKGFWLAWIMLAFTARIAQSYPEPSPAVETSRSVLPGVRRTNTSVTFYPE